MKVSIIVPVFNEASAIARFLETLQPYRHAGHEVIVVDGASGDATLSAAQGRADLVFTTERGRAKQMNFGAARASGDVLLFLHADSQLPSQALTAIASALADASQVWGRFDVRLSGERVWFRVIEALMNWRSRATGIATGDQAIFVKRSVFAQVGGYPPIALMEDVALSAALRKIAEPVCLRLRIVASSRRWERQGLWRTVFLMWRLRFAYALGASPDRLAHLYYPNKAAGPSHET
jgi:rSAM/selenodomain-associated transferase 2